MRMHPFRRPDSDAFTDRVADATLLEIEERGLAAVSVATVAARMRSSRQTLTYQLLKLAPDQDPVSILQQVVVGRFSDRWWRWSAVPALFVADGAVPRLALPRTPEEQQGVRTWHALRELARAASVAGDAEPLSAITAARRQEHAALGEGLVRWTGRHIDPAAVTAAVALVDGLRLAIADPVEPMPADRATASLEEYVVAHAGPPAPAG